jgi:hypothetical protein
MYDEGAMIADESDNEHMGVGEVGQPVTRTVRIWQVEIRCGCAEL